MTFVAELNAGRVSQLSIINLPGALLTASLARGCDFPFAPPPPSLRVRSEGEE